VILQGLAALGKAREPWRVLQMLFRWNPHYCVAHILFNLSQNSAAGEANIRSPWDVDVSGTELKCLLVEGFVYSALTLAIEFQLLSHARAVLASLPSLLLRICIGGAPYDFGSHPEGSEDADVAAERRRVAEGGSEEDILTMKALSKRYPGGHQAVKELSLGVRPGACFGLLGVNGAGKSSTFKMLTGEVSPSSGNAFVRSAAGGQPFSVVSQLSSVRQRVGLCPQEDAVHPRLTAREHLLFYAAVRGVPPELRPRLADELLQRLGLAKWADRLAGGYSGGNKRKLGCAIALVGEPPLVLLDEPSSGMDPEARRAMWGVLARSTRNRAMVLTTHVLAEAEALCQSLAIMVDGRFAALGSLPRLKAVHGAGYALELRCPAQPDAASRVVAGLARLLPSVVLTEAQPGRLTFLLPASGGGRGLADAFETLSREAARLGVLDFDISQTSLESIFLGLAAASKAEEDGQPKALAGRGLGGAQRRRGGAVVEKTVELPASGWLRVECPKCSRLLRWEAAAPIMRCGGCEALVGLPDEDSVSAAV
jgi:ABC-type multidrug transport system ATPase subunit